MDEKKEYKYDAFISYRHCDLDKFVAVNLHKILETYDLPKDIRKKLNVKGKAFKRVFRDQEELPLSSNLEDPILDALENTKYLIVICSPRLKASLWCKKEIETFKRLRGRKNIFCVLIEGEPSDSFPEEVLYDEKEVEVNGKKKKETIMVEPLAADVRGKNKKEVLKKLKEEKLRLIAPMYNLDYDDLKQRHKLWKQRKIINTVIIVALASILFTIYSLAMFIKINLQQNVLAEQHALSLVEEAEDNLNNDDRSNAIKLSYQALTDFYQIRMPYTPNAEYMLSESLGIYDAGLSYKAIGNLKTDGVAEYIKSSYDNKYAALYDGSEKITLFDTKTLSIINSYSADALYNDYRFSFIGNDKLAFINNKGNISIVNTKDGKLVKEIEKDKYSYKAVRGENTGKYLAYVSLNKFVLYDIENDKVLGEFSSKDDFMKEMYFSEDNKYIFVATTIKNYDVNKEDHMTMYVIDTKDGKEINKMDFVAGYISGILTKGNNAYLLLNNRLGTKYNMLVKSYNFIDNKINWSKSFDNNWGKMISRSYKDGTNDIAVVNYDTVSILNANTGNLVESFNMNSEIIGIYSYLNTNMYLAFASSGSVSYMNMDSRKSVEYMGRYEFNLDDYSKVTPTEQGFLLIPTNENRVILYEKKANSDIKEEDIKIDLLAKDSIPVTDYDKIKEEYNIKNKSLVDYMFYDEDKEILFINYKNQDIVIYDTKDKKLLKKLDNVGKADRYYGKDENDRIYIGDVSNGYILDKNYDKVGHIKGLCKVDKDRVTIRNDEKYYSIKIYSLKDMLKDAKEYLDKTGMFDKEDYDE